MEESGMRIHKGEVIDMESKVKISLKVLPFGSIIYETTGLDQPVQEKKPGASRYVEPLTTNIEKIEIRYVDGETYSVPKTTAGI